MRYEYTTFGTCSRKIFFDIDGDRISNVSFEGGCNGNLKAVSKLVDGMTVEQMEKALILIILKTEYPKTRYILN